ncbi:MAG: helix-turn-helix transcriptional regulator [Culicoidibacterales bacterium]
MSKVLKNKLRLLYLQQILLEETNEQYPLTVEELIQRLYDVGLSAERKTIYADMKILEAFGLDLICEQRNHNRANHYYIGQQQFQLPEVKLLIDAVQFSKFITPKKSRELIEKITQLTNHHEAAWLKERLVVQQVNKKVNEQIYISLDLILEALRQKKRITFTYWHYNLQRELVAKYAGERYEVTPYALTLYEHRYYLIAYHQRYQKLAHFRVDLLKDVALSEKCAEVVAEYEAFNVAEYTSGMFSMMKGERQRVELCWHKKQWNAVVDRFGPQVFVIAETQTHVTIAVEIECCTAFYAWVFKFGNDVVIQAPKQVKQAYIDYLQAALRQYQS